MTTQVTTTRRWTVAREVGIPGNPAARVTTVFEGKRGGAVRGST